MEKMKQFKFFRKSLEETNDNSELISNVVKK